MDVHTERLPGALREPENAAGHSRPENTAERIRELTETVEQLKQAVTSHAVIDQAIGVVVAVGRVPPAEAWDALRETSMCTNVKLRRLAELVVAWGRTGALPTAVRQQLTARLDRRGRA
ncbi:ANTAR domain-containing protein [Streptomyces sp. NPDC028635]|uniref:ANTAR domain-containing protein n=1 Tax=Streptomyces sp. NPDC028635 TaxID=3154800 RepID=UPI0033F6DDDF